MSDRLEYKFNCYGHTNIRATHVKTIEITKDTDITERNTCVIGINADFELSELKKFAKKVKLIYKVGDYVVEFKFKVNPSFNSNHELVARKSFFDSERTFGFSLNKGSNNIDRALLKIIQDTKTVIEITLVEGWG